MRCLDGVNNMGRWEINPSTSSRRRKLGKRRKKDMCLICTWWIWFSIHLSAHYCHFSLSRSFTIDMAFHMEHVYATRGAKHKIVRRSNVLLTSRLPKLSRNDIFFRNFPICTNMKYEKNLVVNSNNFLRSFSRLSSDANSRFAIINGLIIINSTLITEKIFWIYQQDDMVSSGMYLWYEMI